MLLTVAKMDTKSDRFLVQTLLLICNDSCLQLALAPHFEGFAICRGAPSIGSKRHSAEGVYPFCDFPRL
jgi:hypothetical protein